MSGNLGTPPSRSNTRRDCAKGVPDHCSSKDDQTRVIPDGSRNWKNTPSSTTDGGPSIIGLRSLAISHCAQSARSQASGQSKSRTGTLQATALYLFLSSSCPGGRLLL